MPSKTPSRPEGEKWFEWPLTAASVGMTAAELIGELYETISALNRDRGWNLTMVAPASFGEIVIDREAGCLREMRVEGQGSQPARPGTGRIRERGMTWP